MTHLTGDAVPVAALTPLRRDLARAATAVAPAGTITPGSGADLRAALAALPLSSLRRGYRHEAVERLVERVAEELDRRARGEKPVLRAEHVHLDGIALARPGYAIAPTRALLAAAADALRTRTR
ncbi:hypothetical protein [Actinotalea solisilvae]|uniref:hypothetical protein n=1 Tax=Actinotalea solisilvae TaxID=2072922 RepID=UPI0018F158BF|nr:hypothetical protein [Actinotalea solisilvae]